MNYPPTTRLYPSTDDDFEPIPIHFNHLPLSRPFTWNANQWCPSTVLSTGSTSSKPKATRASPRGVSKRRIRFANCASVIRMNLEATKPSERWYQKSDFCQFHRQSRLEDQHQLQDKSSSLVLPQETPRDLMTDEPSSPRSTTAELPISSPSSPSSIRSPKVARLRAVLLLQAAYRQTPVLIDQDRVRKISESLAKPSVNRALRRAARVAREVYAVEQQQNQQQPHERCTPAHLPTTVDDNAHHLPHTHS